MNRAMHRCCVRHGRQPARPVRHASSTAGFPVTPSTIAKELLIRPAVTGVGYAVFATAGLGLFGASAPAAPLLAHAAVTCATGSAAFGVGSFDGTITGATRCLIEGRWIVKALPVDAVAHAVAGSTSTEGVEALARQLRDALWRPPFVPRAAGPVWRFVVNQAVPLDALLAVPTRVVDIMKENPATPAAAVAESVLVAVAAEGLRSYKARVRWAGVVGVVMLHGLLMGFCAFFWPTQ